MDFECPKAKFLVSDLPNHGLGSTMRIDAVNFLVGALLTNRTVLFVNNLTMPTNVTNLWPWTQGGGCDRMDHQCFYQPVSPCTVTWDEIYKAPVVQLAHQAPPDARVVRLQMVNKFFNVDLAALKRVHEIATMLIDQQAPNEMRPMLHQAAALILKDDRGSQRGGYPGSHSSLKHAALMYAMRPHMDRKAQIYEWLAPEFPSDFDSNRAFGLPIRASDKCDEESECLSFSSYMQASVSRWWFSIILVCCW